jgi:hypothetical protein
MYKAVAVALFGIPIEFTYSIRVELMFTPDTYTLIFVTTYG